MLEDPSPEVARRRAKAKLALARAKTYRDAADAPATTKAYAADVARYRGWCETVGFTAFPAEPDVVGAYVAAAGQGYALATIRRRVAAIAREAALLGTPLNTRHPAITEVLRGIAKKHGGRQRKAAAIATEDVRQVTSPCGSDLTGLRDRALLLTAFAGAFRRSELVGIDVEHLTWTEAGVIVLIPESKTDEERAGHEVTIIRGVAPATCPIVALSSWLETAGIKQGPVFRKVDRWGKPWAKRLGGDAVRTILRDRARSVGLVDSKAGPISPHGLRAGFVTTAMRNGVSDEAIMETTRHRSVATMRGYVRRSRLGHVSASAKLGL